MTMTEPTVEATSEAEPVARLATTDDAPEMLRVIEAAFDGWPPYEIEVSALEHLQWRLSHPLVGGEIPPAHTVVELDGRIVAVSVRWESRLMIGGEELVQDSGIDQAVLPAMQGRGLGGRMGQFAHAHAVTYSDIALGSGTNHPAIANMFNRFDTTDVQYPLSTWTRAFDPRGFVATHLRGGGRAHLARNLVRWVALRPRRGGATPDGVRIEKLARFDERASVLAARYAAGFDVSVIRSVEYLNWRYLDPRSGPAFALGAFEDGHLLGFAVFKRSRDWAKVLDMAVEPDHEGVADALLEAGCARLRSAGVRGVNCGVSPGHPFERALRRSGFLEAGQSQLFGFGPDRRKRGLPILEALYAGTARMHVMMGDFDIY
jgi:GNAT superfamily N-acetyltransferase